MRALYEAARIAGRRLEGPVDSRHAFIDMANVSVMLENGASAKTCKPAMGFSFAAGTTDGPGAFDFTQGDAHVSVGSGSDAFVERSTECAHELRVKYWK